MKTKYRQEAADLSLKEAIEGIVLQMSGYGYRRVQRELQNQGKVVNHKKVLRLMRQYGLLRKPKRRFRVTTDSNHNFRVYPNLLRDLVVAALNQAWVADITYIALPQGFCYLAVIIDLFSRKVVGFSLRENLDASLSLAALQMALQTRKVSEGLIHHSDRGVQYASGDYTDLLKANQMQISMSARGNPYDNAFAESFLKTLKAEEVYLNDYQDFTEAKEHIESFITAVYNQKRLHSGIDYLSPEQFENLLLVKADVSVSI